MKTKNLTPWQAGVSGNPNGRPKGSRNIKNVIIELLEDPDVYDKLPNKQPDTTKTPIEAIVHTLLSKALDGDVRAADVLLKHAIPRELMPEVEGGFFSSPTELIIRVVEPDGSLRDFYDPNETIDVEPEPSKEPALIEHEFVADIPAEESVEESEPVLEAPTQQRVSF